MVIPYKIFYQEVKTLFDSGQKAEALTRQEKYLSKTNPPGIMLHNYASMLGDVGQHQKAVEICERAFSAGLDAPETWLIYARSLQGIGKLNQAEEAYLKVLLRKPSDCSAHRDLAQLIWMRTRDFEKSLMHIDKALTRFPADLGLKVTRAQILGFMGESQEEYEALKKDINIEGTPDLGWSFFIRAALNAGDFQTSIDLAKRGIDLVGDHFNFREYLVRGLLGAGTAGQALSHIEVLRSQHPDNQYYIALHATAYRLLGDERYNFYFDYKNLVQGFPLATPTGWTSLEGYVTDLVSALDGMHSYKSHPFGLSVRHGSQISSIEAANHPALRAFSEASYEPLQNYIQLCQKIFGDNGPLGVLSSRNASLFAAWSVSLPPGGFHVSHVHPQGWLSSACHLRKVDVSKVDVGKVDGGTEDVDIDREKAGWLKFGEPGIVTEPALKAEFFKEPEIGTMVIFPSFMWHGTIGFEKGQNRLTIAADFVGK